mmetsp:Transcript_42814/g.111013  ORF Transcript_42814/g.111013 Transcript_42814/m.111013 type:complete len:383 (-) Transcript_42814:45-1193(-)
MASRRGLFAMLLCAALWGGAEAVLGRLARRNLDKPGNSSERWQLVWHVGVTKPPRRLVPVRYNYVSAKKSEAWLKCVHDNELQRTLQLTPWPPGTKVLFIGNSFVRELAETAVLDVPDGAIRSMNYAIHNCGCVTTDVAGIGNRCVLDDYLSMPPENRRAALRIDGVYYCDGWNYNGTALAKYNDTVERRNCHDDPGRVHTYDGTTLAQVANHQLILELPLEEGVVRALGLPLSYFDVVIANQANLVSHYVRYSPCPGALLSRPRDSRALPVGNILGGLERGGFSGHLFMVSDRMWQPVPADVHESLSEAEAAGLPFHVHSSSVLDGRQFEVVQTCGTSSVDGSHAVIPGPTLWMMEALRAEYVALTGATGRAEHKGHAGTL